jgi:hypothetical protein
MSIIDEFELRRGMPGSVSVASEDIKTPEFLEMNAEDYLGDMDDLAITEEQKLDLLEILWSIMSNMVALGVTYDVCGQIFGDSDEFPSLLDSAVKSLSPSDRRSIQGKPKDREHDDG